jgi:hypothetical protein
MGKLLIKLCLLFLLVVLFLVGFVAIPFLPNDPIQIYKQKQVLLANTQGRKMVCVGGSGVLHSFSGRLMQEGARGYKVVNMGYNAGLGLRFDINGIKPFIGPGDIILLAPEFNNYAGGCDGSTLTLLAINAFPPALKCSPFEHLSKLVVSNWWQYVPVKMASYLDTISSSLANTYTYVDEYGDATVRSTAKTVQNITINIDIHGGKYAEMVAVLNEFNSFCDSKHARVYLMYPAFPECNYLRESSMLMSLHESLHRDIKMPILYSPSAVTYPATLFHDTEYHMTPKGREVHTRKVISILKQAGALGRRVPPALAPLLPAS